MTPSAPRFGRALPALGPARPAPATLAALARGTDAGPEDDPAGDNPRIAAGWAFFGQLLAHALAHDRRPLSADAARHAEPGPTHRARGLGWQTVYGLGPAEQPYLYESGDPDRLLLERRGEGGAAVWDLPRLADGRAVVPDARDDSNVPVTQLHVALARVHNRLVSDARARGVAPGDSFEDARRSLQWHVAWVVEHEYVPLVTGRGGVEAAPGALPVEFAAGVFRFGHAQLRAAYRLRAGAEPTPLLPDLVGFRPLTPGRAFGWDRLFQMPGAPPPEPSRRIGPRYARPLAALPAALTGPLAVPQHASLAWRDGQRAVQCGVPCGVVAARALGETPLGADALGLTGGEVARGVPLLHYVLCEAALGADGLHLGPVGGRLLSGALVGALRADPDPAPPEWRPTLPAVDGRFTLADLLAAAG